MPFRSYMIVYSWGEVEMRNPLLLLLIPIALHLMYIQASQSVLGRNLCPQDEEHSKLLMTWMKIDDRSRCLSLTNSSHYLSLNCGQRASTCVSFQFISWRLTTNPDISSFHLLCISTTVYVSFHAKPSHA